MTAAARPEPAVEEVLLADQVRRLRRVVDQARQGSVELLFARHVLGSREPVVQAVGEEEAAGRHLAAEIAFYGYAVLLRDTAVVAESASFGEDLQRLSRMDAFPIDKFSFVFDPGLIVGVSAAVARAARMADWDCRAWLVGLLGDPRAETEVSLLTLARAYSLSLLTGEPSALPRLDELVGAAELGFAAWMLLNGAGEFTDRRDSYERMVAEFLAQVLLADPGVLGVARAAAILAAIDQVIHVGARRLAIGIESVSKILGAFPTCMERWRWDATDVKTPIRWQIDAEREVQDILWVMLRPYFEDLVYEDPLPKVGHSSYRTDFGIPSLKLLIEVKYARKATSFKELEKEVMEDSVAYLANTDRYERILVFIYDDSSSSEQHATTRRAMLEIPNISDVIIVSRPGRIPPRTERRAGDG